MRTILILAGFFLCGSFITAAAQTPTVCIFSNDTGTECDFPDMPGVNAFYVFLVDVPGATAVSFSAPKPACMTGSTWISDTPAWPVALGDSQSLASIAFGSCQPGPVLLTTILYNSSGSVAADCAYPVTFAEFTDCANAIMPAAGGTAHVNSTLGCTCAVLAPTPILEVTPAAIEFDNGVDEIPIFIRNVGPGTLEWSLHSAVTWMTFEPSSGVGDANPIVRVDRTGLPVTSHFTTINVSSNGGMGTVLVTLDAPDPPAPTLGWAPAALLFREPERLKGLSVFNQGSGTLQWGVTTGAPWITLTPSSGTNNMMVLVEVDWSQLAEGVHQAAITIGSNGGGAVVPVTAQYDGFGAPILDAVPRTMNFGGSAANMNLSIYNDGGGTLEWTITPNQSWISAGLGSGSTLPGDPSLVAISVDRSQLTDGSHSGSLAISSNGGLLTINVNVLVGSGPFLETVPASLSYGIDDSSQQLRILNTGVTDLIWSISPSASWVTASPMTGRTRENRERVVIVDVDRSTLSAGVHAANLLIAANGGDVTVPIEVLVTDQTVLEVSTNAVTLFNPGSAAEVDLANSGIGAMSWQVVPEEPWIYAVPDRGVNDGAVAIGVDRFQAPSEAVNGTVNVLSNGGDQIIQVRWRPASPGVAGTLGIFTDQQGGDCHLPDPAGSGLRTYYVIHGNMVLSTAAQFAAPLPSCYVSGVWMSDTQQWPVTIGNTQSGVAVGYGTCSAAPTAVIAINVFGQGLAEPCCPWTVTADPSAASGQIEVVDCGQQLLFGTGLTAYVNGNGGCQCTVRVVPSTWGRIKAMYATDPEAVGGTR